MNSRERVFRVLSGAIPDRIPLSDSYWETTIDRWRAEGLPADVAPEDYFGTNEIVRIAGDYTMQMPERVLEETESTRTYWDSDGALRRDLHLPEGWTSQWLDFSIRDCADWEHLRHWMDFRSSRIPPSARREYRRARNGERFVCYSSHACFHPTWMRIGMEHMLVAMLEDPAFVHELFAAHAQLVIDIYDNMCAQGMVFDGAFLADDLGYRSAPLISPGLYRDLVLPHHKRLCDRFAEDGLKTVLHSDGRVTPLIPYFLEAGFAALHPLEVKAGLDVAKLKQEYGDRLVLFGNIDARALSGAREQIEAEIATKIPAAKAGGGYIYHSDHSVPNAVSLENYAFAIELVKQYGAYR